MGPNSFNRAKQSVIDDDDDDEDDDEEDDDGTVLGNVRTLCR